MEQRSITRRPLESFVRAILGLVYYVVEEKPMIKNMALNMVLALTVVFPTVFAMSQDKPPAIPAAPTICSGQNPCVESARMRVMAAYARALILQQNAQQAQKDFQAAATEYQKIQEDALAEEKLPAGSSYQVNIQAGTVTAQAASVPSAPANASSVPPKPNSAASPGASGKK